MSALFSLSVLRPKLGRCQLAFDHPWVSDVIEGAHAPAWDGTISPEGSLRCLSGRHGPSGGSTRAMSRIWFEVFLRPLRRLRGPVPAPVDATRLCGHHQVGRVPGFKLLADLAKLVSAARPLRSPRRGRPPQQRLEDRPERLVLLRPGHRGIRLGRATKCHRFRRLPIVGRRLSVLRHRTTGYDLYPLPCLPYRVSMNENGPPCATQEWSERMRHEMVGFMRVRAEFGMSVLEIGPELWAAVELLRYELARLVAVELDESFAADLAERRPGSLHRAAAGGRHRPHHRRCRARPHLSSSTSRPSRTIRMATPGTQPVRRRAS
jgi:hypothetical protein